jgi:hypothetical protein
MTSFNPSFLVHAPDAEAAPNGLSARECPTVGAVKRQLAKRLKEKGQLGTKKM